MTKKASFASCSCLPRGSLHSSNFLVFVLLRLVFVLFRLAALWFIILQFPFHIKMACKHAAKFFPVMKTPALPEGSMHGKFALVTGGGTGLGRAMATQLSRLGATVAIAGRRTDVLQKTADDIHLETKGKVVPIQMDVSKPEIVTESVNVVEKEFGRLPNIVINNAAGNFIMASERLSANAVRKVVEIVQLGTVNVTTEIDAALLTARRLASKRAHGCAFLNISTPYARSGGPFVMPSAMSKAAVENLTKTLAAEWAQYGMRFNVIAPGPIPTEGAFGRLSNMTMEETVKLMAKTVPTGRCGEPEEIANLAAYMCSDYASWMNGSIIDFDGGQQFLNHGSSFGDFLHKVPKGEWAKIEEVIRKRTGKLKTK
ncbi:hypothetical protein L596_002441 [Steinernema carpocapsae]|uniref:Uncharacterized protein n=1 Tax=Steinernema carpocapsae TaxID=34508 RepID=A0A4U8UT65_STECR|nr:hypothetical protein L596_002441 [Steinernema carpocapsae]